MFTGIISSIGTIESAEQAGDLRVKIACDFKPETLGVGESVACNGTCLTITSKGRLASGKTYFTADVSGESITRTAPGQWEKGAKFNLERSLKLGDTLDGYLVSGHVDGMATLREITPTGDSHTLVFEAPKELSRFIAEKGTVVLDGIALTINKVEGAKFWVNIIPHTWKATTLSGRKTGDKLNLEIDMIARYVARLMEK